MTDDIRATLMRPGRLFAMSLGVRVLGGALGAIAMYPALMWVPRVVAASPAIHGDPFASQLVSDAAAIAAFFLWPAVAFAFFLAFAYVGVRSSRQQTLMAISNCIAPASAAAFVFTLSVSVALAVGEPAHTAALAAAQRTSAIDVAAGAFCKARSESLYSTEVNLLNPAATAIPVSCESRSAIIHRYTVDLSKYGLPAAK